MKIRLLFCLFFISFTCLFNFGFDDKKDINLKLLEAAENGNIDQVKIFLEKGADVNTKNKHGDTVLMRASREGHSGVVKYLIEKGADVNHVQKGGYANTALYAAVLHPNNSEVIKILVNAGANINQRSYYNLFPGRTPLYEAVLGGNYYIENVKTLIELGADPNIKTKAGETPLMMAVRLKKNLMVEILKEAGADKNKLDEIELISFAEKGDLEKVKSLLNNDIDLNMQDVMGFTALIKASMNGHLEIVKKLVQNKVDFNKSTRITENRELSKEGDFFVFEGGNTALHYAIKNNYTKIARLLIEAGADINLRNHEGRFRRSGSNMKNSVTAKILLQTDVNPIKKKGKTALILAVSQGNLYAVKMLIENGAKLEYKDMEQNSALSLARKLGYHKIAIELKKAGAKK